MVEHMRSWNTYPGGICKHRGTPLTDSVDVAEFLLLSSVYKLLYFEM